jgi:7-cyano-7-deazaguanine synthase
MTSLRKGAMVVLSGGQDSTTCLGWALKNFDRVAAVTFDYGQRHIIELEAATMVRTFYEDRTGRMIDHEIIRMGEDVFAGTSPLTNSEEQLEMYDSHEQMEGIIGDRVEKTFVPMRNALILMLAANRAVVGEYDTLVTGVCQADNANYPDCRESFVRSAETTILEALGLRGGEFRIATPLMHLTKAESIHLALELPFAYPALALSHTAYDGKYPPTGNDHASILRAHGFEVAGVPDPLVVRANRAGLMELPTTPNYDAHAIGWSYL